MPGHDGRNRKQRAQHGIAAVEFALILPVIAALLLVLVEGANALHTWSALQEASREGARLVLREGETADVGAVVAALITEVPTDDIECRVVTNPESNTVTVEVCYAYQSFYGENPALVALQGEDEPFLFTASCTMPLP